MAVASIFKKAYWTFAAAGVYTLLLLLYYRVYGFNDSKHLPGHDLHVHDLM
jgi:hypothetical protein